MFIELTFLIKIYSIKINISLSTNTNEQTPERYGPFGKMYTLHSDVHFGRPSSV